MKNHSRKPPLDSEVIGVAGASSTESSSNTMTTPGCRPARSSPHDARLSTSRQTFDHLLGRYGLMSSSVMPGLNWSGDDLHGVLRGRRQIS